MLVEYGPGGYSPGHTHAKYAFIYATVLEGAIRSQVNDDLQGRTELLRAARRPRRRQRQCQQDEAGQAPRGVRGGHERDGTDDPMRELRFNTFRAEILRREKMRDANARFHVLVNPMSLLSVLRSSVRARGPCSGGGPLRAAASEPADRRLQRDRRKFSNFGDGSRSTPHRDRAIGGAERIVVRGGGRRLKAVVHWPKPRHRRCGHFSAAAGRPEGRRISSSTRSCRSSEPRITAWT